MRIRLTHLAPAPSACLMAGCGAYSEVSERPPKFLSQPAGRGAPAGAEADITKGQREDRRKPLGALDEYVDAAHTAEQQLLRDGRDAEAKRDYIFAVGRIMEVIRDAKLTPWANPLTVSGDHGDFTLVDKPDPRPEWNPALFEFIPADQFDVHGKYVTERTVRQGIGATCVAVECETNSSRRPDFAPSRIFRCVTAIARFEGRRCVLSFQDPLATETVTLDGHTFPLAADFTVPLAVMLERTDPKKHEFWFYSYPSGYPYPYSAAILRRELDELEKRYPARKPMVVIGHSMGGCISRLLLTDSGEQLWTQTFGKPTDHERTLPN